MTIGDSVGLILPNLLLQEIGAGAGTLMDIRVKDGEIIATPLRHPREGWAEAAARIGAEPLTEEERDWMAFDNEYGEEWTW